MATDSGIREKQPGVWEVRVHVARDPVTGRLRQVSRTTRKGIADARRIRARLITEVAEGKHGADHATLANLLDEWVMHGERLGRSPSTIAGYRGKIDTGIRPALGNVGLDRLTARHLDRWYAELHRQGTSAAMVTQYHRIISAALHQAERWGWVERNVARLAQPPSVPRKELTVPPPERVRALIDEAASSRAPENASVITLAALTGLRRGELCGLRWADVDWQESSITVRRSIWQTPDGWGVKDPKTHQIRRLLLGEHAMSVLAGRWKRFQDACSLMELEPTPEAYIFSLDITGDLPIMPNTLTQSFSRLCRRMEERAAAAEPPRIERWPYRFQDLRHYTATELFRAGHNPKTVADRLGHADAALTLRVYTHGTEDQARAAATALESGLL
jgi:integrase